MRDLERELRELRVEWPATPDVAVAVRARIELAPDASPARPPRVRHRAWLRPVVAAVVAALALTAAIEPARSAVLEFLGLKGARIERKAPVATPAPSPRSGIGDDLGLGERVTLAEALRRAPFAVPPRDPALGTPDAAFFGDAGPAGTAVSYVYRVRPGIRRSDQTGAALLVTEILGASNSEFVGKAAGADTRIERVPGGYFLTGGPHGVAFAGPSGEPVIEQEQRLAGNTLLLERGGLLVRVEGQIGKARALEIAGSVPPR
jgi:hypothetical protein